MEETTVPFLRISLAESTRVHSVAWNCTGTKLASGSVDQTARVWHIEPHGHCGSAVLGPKHADLIATASGDESSSMGCSWKMCAASRTLTSPINLMGRTSRLVIGMMDVRKFKPIHKRKFNYEHKAFRKALLLNLEKSSILYDMQM
ncbi:unnamed protein product [Prunus armeniaca]|uniref:Uncharacterized protein n=1 Tax=Prunus armeniaca TaxID=36596 RepID=A0A6J5V0Z8_PRUAR|nr:unnamed protein product [Prunus armeniaca]